MVKIFVAQTQEKDRGLVTEFLKSSGYDEVSSYETDSLSLTRLIWDIMPTTKPAVIITSQRGFGNPYVSNMLHTVAFNLPIRTLTVLYTRAESQYDYKQQVGCYIALLKSMKSHMHQLEIVHKRHDVSRDDQLQKIKAYIEAFVQRCPA